MNTNTNKKLAWCVSIGDQLIPSYTRSRRDDCKKAAESDQRKPWEELVSGGAKLVQVELLPVKVTTVEAHPVVVEVAKAFKTQPERILATYPDTSAYQGRCACYIILRDKGYNDGQAARIMGRRDAEATRAGVVKAKEFIQGSAAYAKKMAEAMKALEGTPLPKPR